MNTRPAPEPYRVDRGGSRFIDPRYARVAFRGSSSPCDRSNDLGFRLLRRCP